MRRMLTVSVSVVSILLAGCGVSPNGNNVGVLDRLSSLPDENGNGYPDIPTPKGIDETGRIAIELVNEVTFAEAQQLANITIPAAVSNLVNASIRISIDMDYGNDVTNRLRGTRALGPFDIVAEAACPESVSVMVAVVVEIPLVGEQTLAVVGPYEFEQGQLGVGYECDSVISARVYTDESGLPAADWSIQPLSGTTLDGTEEAF